MKKFVRPTDPDPYREARWEAVQIVREGLAPYMRANNLRMPPPSMPSPKRIDAWLEVKGRVASVWELITRICEKPLSQTDYTLAGPAKGGTR